MITHTSRLTSDRRETQVRVAARSARDGQVEHRTGAAQFSVDGARGGVRWRGRGVLISRPPVHQGWDGGGAEEKENMRLRLISLLAVMAASESQENFSLL